MRGDCPRSRTFASRHLIVAVALVVCAVPAIASRASPARAAEGHFFLLGDDLATACASGEKGRRDGIRVGTYAEAAADGQELYVANGGSPKFCLPDSAQPADLVTTVCDYIKSHPGKRSLAGMSVTLEALAARYPCGR